jgi:hypothetical protein
VKRLESGEQLGVGQELVSDNGLFNLVLQGDGNLVLYRRAFGAPLWASNTDGRPVTSVAMQTDGNLVARESTGVVAWSSQTAGKAGAALELANDGDLAIGFWWGAVWRAGTRQDLSATVFADSDDRGYNYVQVSEWLQDLASHFPCTLAMEWPGYDTEIIEDRIDGQDIVIQLWKGWCPRAFDANTPGGVGAEVGIYRRMPGRPRPDDSTVSNWLTNAANTLFRGAFDVLNVLQPAINLGLGLFQTQNLDHLDDEDLWWPAPDLRTRLESTFINSLTGEPFFHAGPVTSYWLPKWMNNSSYGRYRNDVGVDKTKDLLETTDYWLDYTINGRTYPRWGGGIRQPGGTRAPEPLRPPPVRTESFVGLLLSDSAPVAPPPEPAPRPDVTAFVDLLLAEPIPQPEPLPEPVPEPSAPLAPITLLLS